jgi:hypothetical protein
MDMRRALVLLSFLAACKSPVGGEPPPAELPVSKVVLFQNGVGYFERRGEVKDRLLELRVRPDQVNDVLKSLSVLDLRGGAASAVSLPVEKSGDRLAAELPPQVRRATGLVGLLAVLRGAEVSVETDDGTWDGRVVGVEVPPGSPQKDAEGNEKPNGAVLTLLVDEADLRPIPVAAVKKLSVGDKTLSVGLHQSLDISKREGNWKPVSLQVRFAGDGTRDLVVSYIHEVPVWRPAYRAWVEGGKGVQLEGWGVVDNTSGEDWKDVKLTLVAGAPLSFRYNLHTPHHVERPDLSPRLPQEALAPPEPDIGVETPPPPPSPAPAASSAPTMPAGVAGLFGAKGGGGGGLGADLDDYMAEPEAEKAAMREEAKPAEAPMKKLRSRSQANKDSWKSQPVAAAAPTDPQEEQRRRDAAIRSAQALVTGKEVGALYHYEALHPVTVPDRSAALINILARKLDGKDVFLWREPSDQAPYRAVLLRNDNAGTLEGGPITLYVDGTFAGEGFIGRVQKGETAFVPYAKESGFIQRLESKQETAEPRLAKIVDGRITLEAKTLYKRTLTIESTRDKPSLCYVKLGVTSGTALREPPEDLVRAGSDLYVPVNVPPRGAGGTQAGKGETMLVEESPVTYEDVSLTDRVVDAFQLYLKQATAEEAVKGPIQLLLALHADMQAVERASEGLHKQRDTLEQEQNRIQNNLYALPEGAVAAELRRQLLGQLETASKKAAEVAKQLVENDVKLVAMKEKLVVLLRSVTLK